MYARVLLCMLGCGSLCCGIRIDVFFSATAIHHFPRIGLQITVHVQLHGLNGTGVYMYVHVL